MDYVPPTGSSTATAPYVGKNTAAGTQGSKVPPGAVEYPQREIVAAIAASGTARSNADLTQLTGAIGRGIWLGALALTLGAPNALAGSIGGGAGVIQSLPAWTKLRGFTTQTNTTAVVNVTVTGVGTANGTATGPLLRRDGKPLAVGDVPVGAVEFQPDGAGNFRLVGLAPSEMVAYSAAAPTGKGNFGKQVAGTYTWTVPDGVYWAYATCVAAGGGGSGGPVSSTATTNGGGGGAGGATQGWIAVTPGQVITFVVGAGGGGGGWQNTGYSGGSSSIAGTPMMATGGAGGAGGSSPSGGGGGQGYGGQKTFAGGNGTDGNVINAQLPSGVGGTSLFGGGGRSASFYLAGVSNGRAPGSGGGGTYTNTQNTAGVSGGQGGNGADGSVDFQY